MILSGSKIVTACRCGHITIHPFNHNDINPNSYNYRIGNNIVELHPDADIAHNKRNNILTDYGYTLIPGIIYLSSTYERIGSSKYVTTLLGRSSLGRLGLFLNATADLGHIGCESHWTLELSVVQPLRVYPGMRIGQVAFWNVSGEAELYHGRYQLDCEPTPNRDVSLIRHALGGKLDTVGK